MEPSDMALHQWIVDLDGNVNSWGLLWKLLSGSCVVRVESASPPVVSPSDPPLDPCGAGAGGPLGSPPPPCAGAGGIPSDARPSPSRPTAGPGCDPDP